MEVLLPVEIWITQNTRCMVFEVIFFDEIVKKSDFDHFFTV
jgi:hypothetical protein